MISLRRDHERRLDRRGQREVWATFDPNGDPARQEGFGHLERLDEGRLPPGARLPRRPRREAEVITYVREGAVSYEDSMGRSGVVQAGEFHRLTTSNRLRHGMANASQTAWAHLYQLWIHPFMASLQSTHEQQRFSAAERRAGLCVVASFDGRGGSLPIHQDAVIYASLLDSGQHVAHALATGRKAWLHMVAGEVTLGEVVLVAGDGVGLEDERSVSFTAGQSAEILLVDTGPAPQLGFRRVEEP